MDTNPAEKAMRLIEAALQTEGYEVERVRAFAGVEMRATHPSKPQENLAIWVQLERPITAV